MTSVICDSIEKITVPIRNYIGYQNDITCITQEDKLPEKMCQSDLNICVDRQSPTLLIHTKIMTYRIIILQSMLCLGVADVVHFIHLSIPTQGHLIVKCMTRVVPVHLEQK